LFRLQPPLAFNDRSQMLIVWIPFDMKQMWAFFLRKSLESFLSLEHPTTHDINEDIHRHTVNLNPFKKLLEVSGFFFRNMSWQSWRFWCVKQRWAMNFFQYNMGKRGCIFSSTMRFGSVLFGSVRLELKIPKYRIPKVRYSKF
jgi:hypothetical protein